jgi:hypothetical protein
MHNLQYAMGTYFEVRLGSMDLTELTNYFTSHMLYIIAIVKFSQDEQATIAILL